MLFVLRSWLNDLVVDSPSLRRLYGLVARGRARWAQARGRRFQRVDVLLQAWRLLGSDLFGTKNTASVRALIKESCFDDGRPAPIQANELLREFSNGPEAQRIRQEFAGFPLADRVRMRYPRPNDDPERQGDLMVLKAYDEASGERGVLYLMYSESIRRFPALFDLPRLASRYMFVLEPSWWGYEDAAFLLYLGADLDVVVLAQCRPDFEFIRDLQSNLVPARLGAGDWIDPDRFRPKAGADRAYDLVMVSGWNVLKRHTLLFRVLRKLKREQGRVLTVALIGYPQHWTRAKIEKLMRRYDVQDQCTIFENIPHDQVAQVVGDAKAYVLLSRREGANRGLYESLFCDTPVIVYRHHRGVNLDHVTKDVGRLADDEELAEVIMNVVEGWKQFRPREWALANTGWVTSTRLLNQTLQRIARQRELPWTGDIAGHKNAPNLKYAEPGVYARFAGEYERLQQFLRA
jgi:glycosyltransferase involved in cell wall biosynthesis